MSVNAPAKDRLSCVADEIALIVEGIGTKLRDVWQMRRIEVLVFAVVGATGAFASPLVAHASPFKVLYPFTKVDGNPATGGALLWDGPLNAVFGTTYRGGSESVGSIFKYLAGSYSVVYNFSGGADGGGYTGVSAVDGAGNIYGTTGNGGNSNQCAAGCGTLFKFNTSANQLTTFYSFSGADGQNPFGPLVFGLGGALYGITANGGQTGIGTAFGVSPESGTLATLSDLSDPTGSIVVDGSGAIYGTDISSSIYGDIYRLTPPAQGQTNWTFTILYTFTDGLDGAGTYSGLVADSAGNIYGATSNGGGAMKCVRSGGSCGTLFKLNPPMTGQTNWTVTTLYSFSGGKNGGGLTVPLTVDSEGSLYGVSYFGGIKSSACNPSFGGGLVFKFVPSTKKRSNLHSFSGEDGCFPNQQLAVPRAGMVYGTTSYGGKNGLGTLFQIGK